jgi:hypothetical protein
MDNLIIPDLSLAVSSVNYDPVLRGWTYVPYVSGSYSWVYSALGYAYNNITSTIKRTSARQLTHTGQHEKGLTTMFWVTVEDTDTKLSVAYKYATMAPWLQGVPSWAASTDWADFTFKFSWWLKVHIDTMDYYVTWDSDNSEWVISQPLTLNAAVQWGEDVNGSSFDADLGVYEVKVDLPIGELLAVGDHLITFGIGTEMLYKSDEIPSEQDTNSKTAWIGDVVIAGIGQPQDNTIEGLVTTSKFLNIREISIDLFDSNSWNYKNSILRGAGTGVDTYGIRTQLWTSDGANYHSIANRLLRNKFQLFNKTRQQLSGTISRAGILFPLKMFTDGHQTGKQFLLMSYTYNLETNDAIVQLYEYDNTTEVTLT